MANSAATAFTLGATARPSVASACARATWSPRSTARRSMIQAGARRSSARSAHPARRASRMRNGQQQDLNLNLAQVAQEAEALVGPQAIPGDQAQPLPPPPAEPVNPPDGAQ